MTAKLNENTQYTDPVTSELLNNGFIYIGQNGLDAKENTITIYADRELTTPILNPQRTGDDGRAVNKIWIPGQYSMKVENFENVQKLNDLSLGSDTITGNSILTNVSGTNLLLAEAESPASSLVNNQVYILTAVADNTGAMTLTIDAFPTYPLRKHHDVDMEAGDIEASQTVAVVWNATDSVFELFTNSAVAPLDVLHTQAAAGVKTFTDGIVSDVTGNVTGDLTGSNIFDINGNESLILGATASAVNEVAINNAATGNAPEIIPSGNDTNIDLQLSGKGAGRVKVPFRGCLVTNSGLMTINTSTGTDLTFDTEAFDTDGIHSTFVNTERLTVPAGVDRVRMSGYMEYFNDTGGVGYRQMRILKDGSVFDGHPSDRRDASTLVAYQSSLVSAAVNVTPGEYFTLPVYQNSGGNLSALGNALGDSYWFCMEIIE